MLSLELQYFAIFVLFCLYFCGISSHFSLPHSKDIQTRWTDSQSPIGVDLSWIYDGLATCQRVFPSFPHGACWDRFQVL